MHQPVIRSALPVFCAEERVDTLAVYKTRAIAATSSAALPPTTLAAALVNWAGGVDEVGVGGTGEPPVALAEGEPDVL